MLITFKSKKHGDIMMFGNVALSLIKLMGHSDTVPGSIPAEEVPAALKRLQDSLKAQQSDNDNVAEDDNPEVPVNINTRAMPLIEMLTKAAKGNHYIMWE